MSSLTGAVAAGPGVMHQAQDAFITGLHASLRGGAIIALVTAIAVAVLLRRRRTLRTPGDEKPCPASDEPVPHRGRKQTDAA